MLKKNDFLEIINIFKEDNPNPKTELNYLNELTLLIAIVLSARAQDKTVNKATKDLFEKYNTVDSFIELGANKLKEYTKTIGLYKSKSENIIKLCEIIKNDYNYKIPEDFNELIQLPGVGRKTANVFLSIAKNKNTIGIDTHIFRLSNRIGIIKTNNHKKIEERLMKLTPKEEVKNLHHWLILHGRYICKAKKPNCNKCKISNFCEYFKKLNNKT